MSEEKRRSRNSPAAIALIDSIGARVISKEITVKDFVKTLKIDELLAMQLLLQEDLFSRSESEVSQTKFIYLDLGGNTKEDDDIKTS